MPISVSNTQARDAMKAQFIADAASDSSRPGAWKWEIRQKMWDYMEANDVARFPRPVHHRIPNFVNAGALGWCIFALRRV